MNNSKKTAIWGYIFITPQLFGLIFMSLVPTITAFSLMFFEYDVISAPVYNGLQNFKDVFSDELFWISIKNTFYYIILTVPVGTFIALLLANALNKIRFKLLFRLVYFMPVVTSSVAISMVWVLLYNSDYGLINLMLSYIGIHGPNWLGDTAWAMPAVGIMSIWWGLGYNMVILLSGLQGISSTYYEAAEIDGASKFQQFRKITVPLLSPTLFFVIIMGIIGSFKVFDQAMIMTGGGPLNSTYTMVLHIYKLGFKYFNFGQSSVVSGVLFALIITFTLFQFKFSKKWVHYEG